MADIESSRLWAATSVLVTYATLCAAIWRQHRQRQQATQQDRQAMAKVADGHAPILVAYASQTGSTEELAWQTARSLGTAGVPTKVMALSDLSAQELSTTSRALFLVSTYGEGDPPDNAALFHQRIMSQDTSLNGLDKLSYALLALGDREYTHFCAFGHELDTWLRQQGAKPWTDTIDVDNGDPKALSTWQQQLSHIAGISDSSPWESAPYQGWHLSARQHLNPGSQGHATFHLELSPPPDQGDQTWEAGDLIQVTVPGHEARPREYSIASLPEDGRVHLLVRQAWHDNGEPGLASNWLTASAPLGGEIMLRLRSHGNFRIGQNQLRPLILVGNGTGLAGLRAHIKARITQGCHRNWLIFGERQAAFDFYHREELMAWQASSQLTLNTVFSRDQSQPAYVQDIIRREHQRVQQWVADGAAIYVCGSLNGMAGGVHEALHDVLGQALLEDLSAQGRYRRDVY